MEDNSEVYRRLFERAGYGQKEEEDEEVRAGVKGSEDLKMVRE